MKVLHKKNKKKNLMKNNWKEEIRIYNEWCQYDF